MMEYKGYVAKVKIDEEAGILYGEVINIRDVITFEGASMEEVQQAFQESVDNYLAFCAERGENPEKPFTDSFIRYLQAKKKIDDRALNGHVYDRFQRAVRALPAPAQLLEVGAGIGTMVDRLLERGTLTHAHYTAVDQEAAAVAWGMARLPAWQQTAPHLTVTWEAIDANLFIQREQGRRQWDVLLAHAFLDLVSLPQFVPALLSLLRPGGYGYFTLNFDGATLFEPPIDPELDALIERLYHLDMDHRTVNGQPAGDSRTGRHLFGVLQDAGMEILAAGSSDWVVFPPFSADDAYFLHHILHTIHHALRGHALLDEKQFVAWIARRHEQVETGKLIYMTHQLDFLARKP